MQTHVVIHLGLWNKHVISCKLKLGWYVLFVDRKNPVSVKIENKQNWNKKHKQATYWYDIAIWKLIWCDYKFKSDLYCDLYTLFSYSECREKKSN